MRCNGKCNNSHAPSTALAVFYVSSEPNIPEGSDYENNVNTVSMHGDKFYQIHTERKITVVTSE